MKTFEQPKSGEADLHWLATLLTASPAKGADIAVQAIAFAGDDNRFFSNWMLAWSRRLVIAKAVTAIREELCVSARRMASRREESPALPARSWTLNRRMSLSDLERALLSIDLFPRAAVLLLLFERVPIEDAAILLNADPELVRRGQAIGVRELTLHLARMQGWQPTDNKSTQPIMEMQHA